MDIDEYGSKYVIRKESKYAGSICNYREESGTDND